VKYIHANVLAFLSNEKYDFAICRFLIHYLTDEEQVLFLKNAYNNLKKDGYILLINFVVDERENYNAKRTIFDFIQEKKEISKRTIPTSDDVKEKCKQAVFTIEREVKKKYSISINDFYKSRFNLTSDQVKELINIIKKMDHGEFQICLLLKK